MLNKSVLLIGEPMGLFIANSVGKLDEVENFTLTTCGAEFNVAVGMKRLNHDVTFMTKLGNDLFGRKIVNMMKNTGISTKEIIFSDTNTTGFMFKEKVEEGDPGIAYFRKGSAASTLNEEDVEKLDYSKFDIIHMTGITPALTDSTRKATAKLLEKAKENNITFSFDPNLRPQLWDSTKEMADYMNDMASKADIFMPGINEVKIILGETNPVEICKTYLSMGTKIVIVKLGKDGAYYASKSESGYVSGFKVEKIVDTVGAGDGFAAGFITSYREGLSLKESVRRACAVGAIQVMSKGDNDGLPYKEELDRFMAGEKNFRI